MKPYILNLDGKQIAIPRLTVHQIIEIQAKYAEARRLDLLDDLMQAEVEPSERLARLREEREASESIQSLIRLPFSFEWASLIVSTASADWELPSRMDPEQVTEAAMWCIGYDLNELKARGKGRAEGKA
jgi:hypothetical protein